jgi:predicted lipid-binding transport protein (Tim44 family)
MASPERPRAGVGCLGSLVGLLVLVAVVVAVVFVGFIALGIFAALVVIGLLALAVDRVVLALSPKRRQRRADQTRMFVWHSGQFRSGQVIDTRVIDNTGAAEGPKPSEQGSSELNGD